MIHRRPRNLPGRHSNNLPRRHPHNLPGRPGRVSTP
jgi:hypothetical protein